MEIMKVETAEKEWKIYLKCPLDTELELVRVSGGFQYTYPIYYEIRQKESQKDGECTILIEAGQIQKLMSRQCVKELQLKVKNRNESFQWKETCLKKTIMLDNESAYTLVYEEGKLCFRREGDKATAFLEDLKQMGKDCFRFVLQGDNLPVRDYQLSLRRRVLPQLWQYESRFLPLAKLQWQNQQRFTLDVSLKDLVKDAAEDFWVEEAREKYDLVLLNKENEYEFYYIYVPGKIDVTACGGESIRFEKTAANSLVMIKEPVKEKALLVKFWETEKELGLRMQSAGPVRPEMFEIARVFKKLGGGGWVKILGTVEQVPVQTGRTADGSWEAELVLPKREILNCVQGAGEEYACLLRCGNQKREIQVGCPVNTDYFQVNREGSVKFFQDPEGNFHVWTHESAHEGQKRIRVAVLGTCFTRSCLRSEKFFNPDYKRFYECCYTRFHNSIISLVSEPVNLDYQYFQELIPDARKYLPEEFEKTFFKSLKREKPQYLFWDNYADANHPIIEVHKGCYLTMSMYLKETRFAARFLPQCRIICNESEEYFELYKKSLAGFMDRLQEIVPMERVVLLRGRFSKGKIDRAGNVTKWDQTPNIVKSNFLWEKLDGYVLSKYPKIRSIDMQNTRYYSDSRNPLPPVNKYSPSHYETWYYKEILDKLNKIVLYDLLNQ